MYDAWNATFRNEIGVFELALNGRERIVIDDG